MKPEAINLAAKLSQFSDQWSPKIVGQFNDNDIMVVKVQGEFVWHDHPDTDDFFWFSMAKCGSKPRMAMSHLGLVSSTLFRRAKAPSGRRSRSPPLAH